MESEQFAIMQAEYVTKKAGISAEAIQAEVEDNKREFKDERGEQNYIDDSVKQMQAIGMIGLEVVERKQILNMDIDELRSELFSNE